MAQPHAAEALSSLLLKAHVDLGKSPTTSLSATKCFVEMATNTARSLLCNRSRFDLVTANSPNTCLGPDFSQLVAIAF
eukprot:13106620-Alexandrium_andersonii.AAC.1